MSILPSRDQTSAPTGNRACALPLPLIAAPKEVAAADANAEDACSFVMRKCWGSRAGVVWARAGANPEAAPAADVACDTDSCVRVGWASGAARVGASVAVLRVIVGNVRRCYFGCDSARAVHSQSAWMRGSRRPYYPVDRSLRDVRARCSASRVRRETASAEWERLLCRCLARAARRRDCCPCCSSCQPRLGARSRRSRTSRCNRRSRCRFGSRVSLRCPR